MFSPPQPHEDWRTRQCHPMAFGLVLLYAGHRDAEAIQAKIDELLRAQDGAHGVRYEERTLKKLRRCDLAKILKVDLKKGARVERYLL